MALPSTTRVALRAASFKSKYQPITLFSTHFSTSKPRNVQNRIYPPYVPYVFSLSTNNTRIHILTQLTHLQSPPPRRIPNLPLPLNILPYTPPHILDSLLLFNMPDRLTTPPATSCRTRRRGVRRWSSILRD